jgi:hypothetical protein
MSALVPEGYIGTVTILMTNMQTNEQNTITLNQANGYKHSFTGDPNVYLMSPSADEIAGREVKGEMYMTATTNDATADYVVRFEDVVATPIPTEPPAQEEPGAASTTTLPTPTPTPKPDGPVEVLVKNIFAQNWLSITILALAGAVYGFITIRKAMYKE